MPIIKTKAFSTSDGKMFPTVEEAQKHELLCVFESEPWQVADLTKDHELALRERAVQIIWTQRNIIYAAISTRKPRTPKAKPAKVSKAKVAAVKTSEVQA